MTAARLRSLAIAVLCASGLFLTSCIENSTVIKVRKDGSGEIFARYYFSPQMTGMLGMMSGFASELSGSGGGASTVTPPSADDLLKPTRETLEDDAASYGTGVRYGKHELGKNASGWDGYLVVYTFDDINQLKFDPTKPPGPMDDLAKTNPAAAQAIDDATAQAGEIESPVKFNMAGGVLTINTGISPDTLTEIGDSAGSLGGGGGLPGGGSISGPDGTQIDAAAAMQMAAGMFQGMRIAYFLRIDGEIAETNAQHVDGTLITMSDMQPGTMMADPNFTAIVKEAESLRGQQPEQEQVDAMMKKVEQIKGIKIETQEQVTVRFK